MESIHPADPRLRRVHRLSAATVAEKTATYPHWEPVLIQARRIGGRTCLVVWDGNHRMQAALEMPQPPMVDFIWADDARVREHLQGSPLSDPQVLLRRSRRFAPGEHT